MSLPPLIIPGAHRKWSSPGPMEKPSFCEASCRFNKSGYGFCPDFVPENPKVALIFDSPGNDDLNEQRGLSGKMGWYIIKNFIEPHFRREDCIVSHVLRCKLPWKKGRKAYPTATTKHQAERVCRKYDCQHGHEGKLISGGIQQWSPNMFVITFAPSDCHLTPAYVRQIQRHVGKARRLADAGFRPAILFGKEACAYFAGFTQQNGGLKDWAGHHFEATFDELILISDQDKEFEGKKIFPII